jgi:hypothetical protein
LKYAEARLMEAEAALLNARMKAGPEDVRAWSEQRDEAVQDIVRELRGLRQYMQGHEILIERPLLQLLPPKAS